MDPLTEIAILLILFMEGAKLANSARETRSTYMWALGVATALAALGMLGAYAIKGVRSG